MFTGIITHTGTVLHITQSSDWTFTIGADNFTQGMAIGASIACNGVCLTAIAKDAHSFTVQVSQETLSRTTLSGWREGTRIHLERALKAGDELGGHFVSGHVDGLAEVLERHPAGGSVRFLFSSPPPLSRFIAEKGSVTLDGVSLTVNDVAQNRFCVNIIPHTLAVTTLGERMPGDKANLEIDIIARYLARMHPPEGGDHA